MARATTLKRARPSRPARAPGLATRERIVAGALELLNAPGGGAVTTNHIAAHLGMSPGNLYYHFRNREEIVRAIFPRVEALGLEATTLPAGPLSAHEFGERHLGGLTLLWDYRFFFRDLHQLLARDEVLAERYRDYARRLRGQYRALFARLIAQGDMRAPVPAEDLDRLVTDAMVLWINWLPHLTALRPREAVTPADVADGALHSFLVVAPWLTPAFAAEARAVLERHARRAQRTPGAS